MRSRIVLRNSVACGLLGVATAAALPGELKPRLPPPGSVSAAEICSNTNSAYDQWYNSGAAFRLEDILITWGPKINSNLPLDVIVDNLYEGRAGDDSDASSSQSTCQTIASPTTCDTSRYGDCDSSPAVDLWFIKTALVNFNHALNVLQSDVFKGALISALDIPQIVSDIMVPIQSTLESEAAAAKQLIAAIATAFFILVGLLGFGPLFGPAAGVAGAGIASVFVVAGSVLNEVNNFYPTIDVSQLGQDASAAMSSRLGNIVTQMDSSYTNFVTAVMTRGDISYLGPQALASINGEGDDISKLFAGGRFVDPISWPGNLAEEWANQTTKQLIGVALNSIPAYINKGHYNADECADPNLPGNRLINGICYTLEIPGPGGEAIGLDTTFTRALDTFANHQITDVIGKHYAIDLYDLYTNSEDCQSNFGYGGLPSAPTDNSFTNAASGYPRCFFNVPVLETGYASGEDYGPGRNGGWGYDFTPCEIALKWRTAGQAGLDYLPTGTPSNLQKPFDPHSGICSNVPPPSTAGGRPPPP